MEDKENNSERTKPIGDAANFCPVALKELDSLWPGNAQVGSVLYKDKIYRFSSPEAKEKFALDPEAYLPLIQPLKVKRSGCTEGFA